MKKIPECFETTPIVYAVGKNYQIMVPVSCETLMWVEVGGRRFYDDINGIIRSRCTTHRMTLPMSVLDEAEEYTICYRIVNERKPYFSDVSEVLTYTSPFRPLKGTRVNFYHIADAHNRVEQPVRAASYFKDCLDLLVLNGDIPNHSGKLEYFTTIHKIASEITDGELPVVFARGNHDMRGIYAENICEHTPVENGNSYYTFRLGGLWGLVLDCGEDKPDDHPEYGFTVCGSDFRRRQTEFIKNVVANAEDEYLAEGVTSRIVVCHSPFTQRFKEPFDIEQDTYAEWTRLLREYIKPQIMVCGHVHYCDINPVGGERDYYGQPCPMITASRPSDSAFTGGFFELTPNKCRVRFTDCNGNVIRDEELSV